MTAILLLFTLFGTVFGEFADQAFMPTRCEICALTALEFNNQASRVHKRLSSEFADMSENVCKGFNEYKVHKEKTGLARFSREPSKTIAALKQMRDKGVKVELGMPYEMWDQPSAEIFALRQGCESLLENYDDLIEDWFLHKEHVDHLLTRLCRDEDLKRQDSRCLPLSRDPSEL